MPPATGKIGRTNIPLFKDARPITSWDDGAMLVEVKTPEDLDVLGRNGGGCAGSHFHWTTCVKKQGEFFLVYITPKGNVGCILFCKRAEWYGKPHPEDTPAATCRHMTEGRYGRCPGRAYDSVTYDRGAVLSTPEQRRQAEAKYLKADLDYYTRRFEQVKANALRYGPLGPRNPLKYDLDEINRHKGRLKQALDALMKGKPNRLMVGATFRYRMFNLAILEVAGRYNNGVKDNGLIADRLNEWMEKQDKRRRKGGTTPEVCATPEPVSV